MINEQNKKSSIFPPIIEAHDCHNQQYASNNRTNNNNDIIGESDVLFNTLVK
jgi:hypothetical protein